MKKELEEVLHHLDEVEMDSLLAESDEFELVEDVEAEASNKLTAEYAGYMELEKANKDGSCSIVNVPGGISKERGCCNVYTPKAGATAFGCGMCKFES